MNIKRRWTNHKKDAFWESGPNYEYPLYRAIRKYGIKNFSFEIIEECEIDKLNEREIFYITKYGSYGNGYNQTRGGTEKTHQRKLSEKEIDEVIYKLKTSTESIVSIAASYGVTEGAIRHINTGESCVRNGEVYPIRKKHLQNSDSHPKSGGRKKVEVQNTHAFFAENQFGTEEEFAVNVQITYREK